MSLLLLFNLKFGLKRVHPIYYLNTQTVRAGDFEHCRLI